ncbi:hypothetical protein N184_24455 [Sinorhizobium sp. GL28]|nr:hypothetical protein N183_14670 [Sinorhizobium sp. Sb3]KSV91895.1 hypothetical protein N184_24455 [Sinorhizobium sp. GL28]
MLIDGSNSGESASLELAVQVRSFRFLCETI